MERLKRANKRPTPTTKKSVAKYRYTTAATTPPPRSPERPAEKSLLLPKDLRPGAKPPAATAHSMILPREIQMGPVHISIMKPPQKPSTSSLPQGLNPSMQPSATKLTKRPTSPSLMESNGSPSQKRPTSYSSRDTALKPVVKPGGSASKPQLLTSATSSPRRPAASAAASGSMSLEELEDLEKFLFGDSADVSSKDNASKSPKQQPKPAVETNVQPRSRKTSAASGRRSPPRPYEQSSDNEVEIVKILVANNVCTFSEDYRLCYSVALTSSDARDWVNLKNIADRRTSYRQVVVLAGNEPSASSNFAAQAVAATNLVVHQKSVLSKYGSTLPLSTLAP